MPNTSPKSTNLDVSRFPVVVISESGVLTNGQRAELLESLDSLLEGRGRHGIVLDLTHGAPVPDEQRMYIGDALELRSGLIAEKWASMAVVVAEPVVAHMAMAAFWMKVSPVPARMFSRLEDAVAWTRARATGSSTRELSIVSIPLVDEAEH